MRIGPTESVFNESSNDLDFRVESNGNANAIFVNAGDDRVTFFNGTTINAASGTDDGVSHYSDGRTDISRASAQALNLRRRTDDGVIVNFYKEASGTVSSVGSISTWGGELAIGRLNCALVFDDDVNRIKPASVQSSGARDNALDLGDPSHRFNDMWIGGGVHLGGTGDANKLDDYEEGTFTPDWTTTGTDFDQSGTANSTGQYTKIGNMVIVTFSCVIGGTVTGGTGNVSIAGMPFTCDKPGVGQLAPGRITLTYNSYYCTNVEGATTVNIVGFRSANTGVQLLASDVNGNGTPFFTTGICYRAS